MRFKKGSKVEVLTTKEVPSGAWRYAVIVSGNGHSYSVRYDCSQDMKNESVVHRVSRKAIRPLPPIIGAESWKAGDVVEVFDDSSWKIATVLRVMNGKFYLVRLLGSSKQFQVHKVNTRLRQSWQDEEWVLIGKGSGSCEITKCYKMLAGDDHLAAKNNSDFQESYVVSARTLKRASPFSSSYAESWTGNVQKTRPIEQDCENQQVVSGYQQVVSGYRSIKKKKVDAVAYPRETLGETYMHASSNNQMNGYYEMVWDKTNCVTECSNVCTEANDYDSEASSVGSCSVISNTPCKFSRLISPSQDAGTFSSDAESFDERGDEGVAAKIHSLELHAYRCTLKAFYASGPLSWEQEALLTNLRLSLHISNDEHLVELRNLISAGTSYHCS